LQTLRQLGAHVAVSGDVLQVDGGPLHEAVIDPHSDHRIAMACAVAALGAAGSVGIEHDACVNKSYPRFFEDLRSLGAIVT
jgi:3-phosphoshikimate 1-carboxyvinyltransferase